MNADTRRGLAAMLSGVAGAIVALTVASFLRQHACLDAGGRWVAATRTCELAAGAAPPTGATRAYLLGAVVGIVAAALLWRTYTFFVARATSRGPG